MTLPYGFRIVGRCNEARVCVEHARAFGAYASCDVLATVEREAYLSAFTFSDDFCELLQSTGSCRGFDGACWSAWLWFDIDRADLEAALRDARRLVLFLIERYRLDDDALLIFFSGAKGLHLGLPSALWESEPSVAFNVICRRLAEGIAQKTGIVIDESVYTKVTAFRAPNSRHPKTGLHKRRLTFDELMGLSLNAIRQLAEKPAPFDLSDAPPIGEQAKVDWLEATERVRKEDESQAMRTANGNGKPTLNRLTLDFIRNGAGEGDRHRLLYSAACNLAEFGCPPALAHALLGEPALDSGLAPKDVTRQIDRGLKDERLAVEKAPTPTPCPVANAGDVQKQLAALWQGPAPPALEQPPATTPTPTVEQPPMAAVDSIRDHVGDAWEPPADKLGAGDGPYSKEGGRL